VAFFAARLATKMSIQFGLQHLLHAAFGEDIKERAKSLFRFEPFKKVLGKETPFLVVLLFQKKLH